MIVAVDGPAASGKGTIARALARHYRLPHMDTGLLYRAVALNLLRWDGDPAGFVIAGSKGTISSWDYDQTVRVQTRASEAGEVIYACHVAGHYTAGMKGTISVE